jgi:hypothetical protein
LTDADYQDICACGAELRQILLEGVTEDEAADIGDAQLDPDCDAGPRPIVTVTVASTTTARLIGDSTVSFAPTPPAAPLVIGTITAINNAEPTGMAEMSASPTSDVIAARSALAITNPPAVAASPTALSASDRAEAERLLIEMRTGLQAICEGLFGRPSWPPRLAMRFADAIAIAEAHVTDAAKELARGWNPLDLLRRQVAFTLERAQRLDRADGELDDEDAPPVVPEGRALLFQDVNGRPTEATNAYLWTWEGGPRWFYAAEHPPPVGHACR